MIARLLILAGLAVAGSQVFTAVPAQAVFLAGLLAVFCGLMMLADRAVT